MLKVQGDLGIHRFHFFYFIQIPATSASDVASDIAMANETTKDEKRQPEDTSFGLIVVFLSGLGVILLLLLVFGGYQVANFIMSLEVICKTDYRSNKHCYLGVRPHY